MTILKITYWMTSLLPDLLPLACEHFPETEKQQGFLHLSLPYLHLPGARLA